MAIKPEEYWKTLRTDETRMVEAELRKSFEEVDAYRYNSAVIRLRIVSSRFEGLRENQRIDFVEPFLEVFPKETQTDLIRLDLRTPAEPRVRSWFEKHFEGESKEELAKLTGDPMTFTDPMRGMYSSSIREMMNDSPEGLYATVERLLEILSDQQLRAFHAEVCLIDDDDEVDPDEKDDEETDRLFDLLPDKLPTAGEE